MRARNAWIFAGIAAAAGLAVVLYLRSRPAAPGGSGAAGPGSAARVAPPPSPATPGDRRFIPPPARQAPRLDHAGGGPADLGTTTDEFDAEVRDEAWAGGAEEEVRQRLAHLALASADTECRRSQCRIVLTARDEATLSTAVSGLGEPGALYDFADQIVLTGQGSTAEGEPFVVVYAQFERP